MSLNRPFILAAAAFLLTLIAALLLSTVAEPADAGAAKRGTTYTIKITFPATNTGTGKVTAPGIDCPGDCEETYPSGQATELVPTPDPGSTFDHWGGSCEGAESGSKHSCVANGSGNIFASAIFNSTGPPADTTPPDTTISKSPEGKVKTKKSKAKVKFEFGSSEANSTFECSLDDIPFEACTSPHKLKAKVGKHTFQVRATDGSGNADQSAATSTFKVVQKKGD
jgi:hypothetical protein